MGGYVFGDKIDTQRVNEMTRREKTSRCWIGIHADIPRRHELHEEIPSGDLGCNSTVENDGGLLIDLAVYTKERNIRR